VNLPIFALADETCRALATRLAVHQLERLPVVDDAATRRLIGIVSRSDLIKPALSLHAEELTRQTVRPIWSPKQRPR
ncbi:MAG TPA: CBS domain-containing protein, partial [Duganella sp.]|nr:CBS domain-containing protein [Duganella sp.]